MSEIRTSKSLESLSASLNRALAGARHHQVVAARREHLRQSAGHVAAGPPGHLHRQAAAHSERLAARGRTYLLLGTLDRFRQPAGPGRPSRRGRRPGAGPA
jgi:uncharacterized membrane protein YccC